MTELDGAHGHSPELDSAPADVVLRVTYQPQHVREALQAMVTKHDDLLEHLGRFSEPALYILISLAGGPKHGYAMTLDIEAVSGQKLGPGTLYGAIARLETLGWIEPLPADERRRPYRLTSAGDRVLRHRLQRLQALTRVGRARLAES